MIEVLVSDLGQVVLPFDFTPSKEFLRRHSRKHHNNEIEDPWLVLSELHDRLAFGTGGCPGQQFYEETVAALDMDASYEAFCKAWSDVFVEDHAVVELIRWANVRYRFLLSNTNEIHWEWVLANHGEILGVFDRLLASQELRAMKPDPEIYRKVERLTGLPPETHLLIDDLAANIEGARACGWDGIVHTDAANLERELHSRGLLG